jgi:hypothetical protein
MQLSNTQITALLTEVASQEDGFNELLRMSFEALMKAERREHLIQSTEDKGNGFRQVHAYGRGKMLELRVPRHSFIRSKKARLNLPLLWWVGSLRVFLLFPITVPIRF